MVTTDDKANEREQARRAVGNLPGHVWVEVLDGSQVMETTPRLKKSGVKDVESSHSATCP